MLVGRVVAARAGQDGFHAGGDHAALDTLGEVPEDLLLRDGAVRTLHNQALVGTTEVRVDDYALTGEVRAGLPDGLTLTDRLGGTTGDTTAKQRQRMQRVGAADTVVLQTGVQLVVHQRLVGGGAEAAVDAVGVKAELVKLRLQLTHIVADHFLARLVAQHARAQRVGGFAQLAERQVVDGARRQNAARLLEGFEGFGEGVVEKHLAFGEATRAIDFAFVSVEETEAGQRQPNLGNPRAGVANVQQVLH